MTDRHCTDRRGFTLVAACLLLGMTHAGARAQGEFRDGFDGTDPSAAGWTWATGDGDARMRFTSGGGTGRIEVDARDDRRNIWWALIRHAVTPAIDTTALARPDRELRVEARVRTNTAPRRINLHVNHSRTTDFHSHLMEYDLPTAGTWFDLSMTTRGFDARPGDEVFVQLALMDWGRGEYALELDHIKVTVVDPAGAGPDRGRPLPYRPDVPPPGSYAHAVPAAAAATLDLATPGATGQWSGTSTNDDALLLAGPSAMIVLRWDFAGIRDRRVPGWGVLQLMTEAAFAQHSGLESYDELRLVEILGGDPDWRAGEVSYERLLAGRRPHEVINEQLIIDAAPAAAGQVTLIPVSPPVLERLLDGRSRGLAIMSHGGIVAAFRNSEIETPTLHFDSTDERAGPND